MKRSWIMAVALAMLPVAVQAKVLLWEDFSSGALSPRWSFFPVGSSTAEVVDFEGNEVLKMESAGAIVTGDPAWTDYTVEGDIYIYDGNYSAYSAGLLFRGTGDLASNATSSAYTYQGRSWITELQKWTIGQGWATVTADGENAFPPGAWRRFKVVCRGSRFLFYLDGRLVQEHNDPAAYLSGQVGFASWGVGAYFDNLLVTDETPDVALFEDFSAGVIDGRWQFQDQNGPGGSQADPAAFLPEIVTTPDGKTAMKLSSNGVAVIGDPLWTDYTVEADVFVYDDWYGSNAAGLVFRATPPLGSWYGFDCYVLQGRTSAVQVEKWNRGAQYEYPLYSAPPSFPARSWHHLMATVDGAIVQVWVDGVFSGQFVDPAPHLAGAVGFRDYMLGGYFTNLKVTPKDVTAPVTTLVVDAPRSASGWYTSPYVTGSITATDGQSPVREIFYGYGGMMERANAGDAIAVAWSEGVYPISFHAVDAFGNVEPQQAHEVKVDGTAPWVSASFPCTLAGNAGWCRAPIAATLGAGDGASGVSSLAYTVGTTVTASTTGTAAFTLGEGSSLVTWSATDVAGNASAAESATLLVDATRPRVRVTATPDEIDDDGDLQAVRIDGWAKDAVSGLASSSITITDRSGTTIATPAFGDTVMLAGTRGQVYRVTATAADIAGNVRTTVATVKVD